MSAMILLKGASVEDTFVSTIKLSLAAAVLCGGVLAMPPISGAMAAPMGSIGKATVAIDSRAPVHYYGYHHYRHCWWHHGRRFCRW